MMYKPNPIDTSKIKLPKDIEELSEVISKNVHEVWSAGRINDGWKYGKERDDNKKEHPSLIPYEELSEGEKDYDRNTSRETLKVIQYLGYKIVPTRTSRIKQLYNLIKEESKHFFRYKLSSPIKFRRIDRILSGGMFKQLVCLILVSLFIWAVLLFFAQSIMRLSSKDLLKSETSQVESTIEPIEEELPLWWVVYYHFVDPGSQHLTSPKARTMAMIISIFGSIILYGLLISTFSNIIDRRVDSYKKGLIKYSLKNHVIIFGYNDMTACLVKQLARDTRYCNLPIVIQTSKEVEAARIKLYSELTDREAKNIIFVYARRDMKDELKDLDVDRAKEIFILGESYMENVAEYAHDSLNMDCLTLVSDICQERGRRNRIRCNVLFEYQTTFSAFQFSDLSNKIKQHVEFFPFNFFEDWAHKVFVTGKSSVDNIEYQPLDREMIDVNSDKRVHLVVVGISKMGVAMAMKAAHLAHYPNFQEKGIKSKITFIDCRADQEMQYILTRYRNLFDLTGYTYIDIESGSKSVTPPNRDYKYLGDSFIDIEWEFIKGDVAHPKVQKMIEYWSTKEDRLLTMAVCFNFPHTSLSCALYLPEKVYTNNIPVLVLQRDSSAVIKNLTNQNSIRYKNLKPFGMESDGFDLDASSLTFAKRVKYVYGYFYGKYKQPDTMPDTQTLDDGWYKEKVCNMWSNIYNASTIDTKLRSVGYKKENFDKIKSLTPDQIEILSEVEHNRWNVEKLMVGFRPPLEDEYNDIKASIKKKGTYKNRHIHYDIVPYDDLQPDDQGHNAKDYDECIVKALPLIINS